MARTLVSAVGGIFTANYRIYSNKVLVYSGTTKIPYVVIWNTSANAIEMIKGNASSPTSFALQDAANNPLPNPLGNGVCACIDSSENIHVFAYTLPTAMAATKEVRHYVFRTIDHATSGDRDKWITGAEEQVVTLNADATLTGNISCCVDTSDNLHLVYEDRINNMGSSYGTMHYIHHNGTSWQGAVEIDGQANQVNVLSYAITLAKNSSATIVPQIACARNADCYAFIGDALDPTTFGSGHQVSTDNPDVGSVDIACDSSRDNTYFLFSDNSSGDLKVADHTNSSSWTTGWTVTTITSTLNYNTTAIHPVSSEVYVLAEEGNFNIELWLDSMAGWSEHPKSPLDDVAQSLIDVSCHWSTYVNNEPFKIGYVYVDNSLTDLYYNEYRIVKEFKNGTPNYIQHFPPHEIVSV